MVAYFASEEWIDNPGIETSLRTKLENEEMQAFMNEVEAQRGKYIQVEAANYLLGDVNALFSQSKK